jgi:3-dehydroquinate synthase
MKVLHVELDQNRNYPIYIGSGLLNQAELLRQHIRSKQVLIVSNETIAPLYLATLQAALGDYQVETVILPDGEQYKNLAHLEKIFDQLLAKKFSRNATLIALGGGVIGDMGGFAAACYQRGIVFIQIPTTLLAQVDSSVGGKTGVNHPLGKNMIGAFYQPQCVIADADVLDTLDDRQLAAGLAEVIKYGLIRDAEFLDWLEANMPRLLARDKDALAYAIGTCFAADLSRRLGWLNDTDVERVIKIFQAANLPVTPPAEMSTEQYVDLMAVDKKNVDGKIRVILLEAIGKASLPVNVELAQLQDTLNNYSKANA